MPFNELRMKNNWTIFEGLFCKQDICNSAQTKKIKVYSVVPSLRVHLSSQLDNHIHAYDILHHVLL